MSKPIKVYAMCPKCRKQVLTTQAESGARILNKHVGEAKGKTCEHSYRVVTGWVMPEPCRWGCGRTATTAEGVCIWCREWADAETAKIDGGSHGH